MLGNYQNARILVRNRSSGYFTGIANAQGHYISDNQLTTLNATERIKLVRVIAWSTRILFLEVIPANDNAQPGTNSR